MTDIVPREEIERLVGAKRHPTVHIGRADTALGKVFILHPESCLRRHLDLRKCPYSLALDNGFDVKKHGWYTALDEPVILWVDKRELIPLRRSLATSTVVLIED